MKIDERIHSITGEVTLLGTTEYGHLDSNLHKHPETAVGLREFSLILMPH